MIDKLNAIVGKSLNDYNKRIKPTIDDLKFKEAYQGKIIDCMVGEVDDNYIETPETNNSIVKLEHSKEGIVKIPSIKGKTILVDRDGNETNTPGVGCRYISVGEEEDNKLVFVSKNKNLINLNKITFYDYTATKPNTYAYIDKPNNGFIYGSNIVPLIRIGINLKPNTTYAFYGKPIGGANQIRYEILVNGSKISDSGYVSNLDYHHIFTMPNSISEVVFKVWSCTNSGQTTEKYGVGDLFLYEYSSKLSFTPPQSHQTEILLSEPLRSLPNGVCDEIIGNKVIRRVGVRKIIAVADEGIVDVNVVD